MIKLIACDLDGTLLNEMHELDKEDSIVIEDIIRAGIKFMIATGRSYEGAKNVVEPYGIACDYVLLNGAMIRTHEEGIVYEVALTNSMLKTLITILQEEDMCYHMYTKEGMVTFDAPRFYKEALAHMMRNGLSEENAKDVLEKGKFGSFDIEVDDIDAYLDREPIVYKIELFSVSEERQKHIVKRLRELKGLEITNSVADNVEITCTEAQKGLSLLKYCESHGIQMDEVLVFGDSLNDHNMLSTFPNSFAVKNATPQIRETASYMTDTNVEHGVTNVLKAVLKHPQDMNFLKAFKKNTL